MKIKIELMKFYQNNINNQIMKELNYQKLKFQNQNLQI